MFCRDTVKGKEFSASNNTDFKVISPPVSGEIMENSHKESRWEEERLRRGRKIPPFLFTGFDLDLINSL